MEIGLHGKYQFKYHVNGKAHFVYSWRLEPTDKLPAGKKPCLSYYVCSFTTFLLLLLYTSCNILLSFAFYVQK